SAAGRGAATHRHEQTDFYAALQKACGQDLQRIRDADPAAGGLSRIGRDRAPGPGNRTLERLLAGLVFQSDLSESPALQPHAVSGAPAAGGEAERKGGSAVKS